MNDGRKAPSAAALDADPIARFRRWLSRAEQAGIPDHTAATLATASVGATPSARMVLLKEVDASGFIFSTNRNSRKARELKENPRAALLFHWQPLHRQVRVEGTVEDADAATSNRIFAARPRGARISAWASAQSEIIDSRETLELCWKETEARFPRKVPRPPFWGAYRLSPVTIEFWRGRTDRLHVRERYVRLDAGNWRVELLAP